MSAYRAGVVGAVTVDLGSHSLYRAGAIGADTASAELVAYNKQLQIDIKAAVKSFPKAFSAAQAAALLATAAEYGKVQIKKFKGGLSDWLLGFIGRPINTHPLELAVAKAESEAKVWKGRADGGQTYVFNQGANKEWGEVNKQVMTVYTEVGGLIGERVTLDAAKEELKTDLNPTSPMNIAKIVGITAAVVGGGVFLMRTGKGH
jgi:hypothetical protein